MLQSRFDSALRTLVGNDVERRRFLLAVSGGIDSMCMANLFLRSPLNLHFSVAHVNFSLREHDCDLDQELVRQWAESNEVTFHTIKFDTHAYAQEHSISTQMAARDLRYGWFYQLMEENGYDLLSIAHNQNDSVETLFLNLLRGTGVRGLMGIHQTNGRIVRPLMDFTRAEISAFMEERSYAYRDDQTNFESHYSRNRVRNVIFPEFRKINPSFMSTVYRSTCYFSQASEILDDLLESKRGVLYEEEGDRLSIDIDQLKKEKQIEYWLFRLISVRGFNAAQIRQITEVLDGVSGKIFRSGTDELLIDRGKILIYPLTEFSEEETLELISPGVYTFRNMTLSLEFLVRDSGFSPKCAPGQLFLDADQLKMPLICRAWKPADKFRPFGMSRGFKKISDFYTDLKFSKPQKQQQPLIFNGEDLICLPGLRIDDRYKIRPTTRLIAEIRVLENEKR